MKQLHSYNASEYFLNTYNDKSLHLDRYFDHFTNHNPYLMGGITHYKNMFAVYTDNRDNVIPVKEIKNIIIKWNNLIERTGVNFGSGGIFDFKGINIGSPLRNEKFYTLINLHLNYGGCSLRRLGAYIVELNVLHLCDLTHSKYFAKPIIKRIISTLLKKGYLRRV